MPVDQSDDPRHGPATSRAPGRAPTSPQRKKGLKGALLARHEAGGLHPASVRDRVCSRHGPARWRRPHVHASPSDRAQDAALLLSRRAAADRHHRDRPRGLGPLGDLRLHAAHGGHAAARPAHVRGGLPHHADRLGGGRPRGRSASVGLTADAPHGYIYFMLFALLLLSPLAIGRLILMSRRVTAGCWWRPSASTS